MASSLKGYIPALARLMHASPAAVYERQRALVRAGQLAPEEGRGPGSGVRTTAPSVALLILATLASDNLRESAGRVAALASARPVGAPRCPLTRRTNFGTALAFLLSATGTADSVAEIDVSRTAPRARIRYYNDAGEIAVSEFAVPKASEPELRVTATLSGAAFNKIASDIQAIVLESFNREEQGQ